MKFSILIPVYNVEKYIRECLDSVMSQTYKDYEVILVDDGSTDSSGRVCDEYQAKYSETIRVIHKENQGLISARRVGIRNADGEFCVFVDSDDFVEPDLLKTIADYLSRDEEIDILLYSYRYLRDGVKAERHPIAIENGTVWSNKKKRQLYERLIYTDEITSIWTKAIRTEILQSDPTPYEKYYKKNMAEDLLQSLFPITAARKVCYTDSVLYNYRINTDSISHNYSLERVAKNDTKHVYYEIEKSYLSKWGMDSEDYRKRLNARWFHHVMYQFVKCYEQASDKKSRQMVMEFHWNEMLPDDNVGGNIYISDTYNELYTALIDRRFFFIKCFFVKKKIVKLLRRLKHSVMRKEWRDL